MTIRLVRFLVLITVSLVASACTITVEPAPHLDRQPLIEKLPIAVGVYYSDELRDYVHAGSTNMIESWRAAFGPPSIVLFDEILGYTFEEWLPVESKPPLQGSDVDRLAGVIAPRIGLVSAWCPDRGDGKCTVMVGYSFTLYAMDGSEIATWMVHGDSQRDFWGPQFGFASAVFMQGAVNEKYLGDLLEESMAAAGAQFWPEFYDSPGVQRWIGEAIAARRPVE